MIKRRLKVQYFIIFVGLFVLLPIITFFSYLSRNSGVKPTIPDHISENIIENTLPVVNTMTKIINPFVDSEVTLGKDYYEYKGEESTQINSIILHDNTYLQNNGIDYVSEKIFEVVTILDGTVVNVLEEELNGMTVEIQHENGMVSKYSSLSETNVKKGDLVTQGQVIGKSGKNELAKDLGNHLHFEIYENGQAKNPENYLNKEVVIKKEN